MKIRKINKEKQPKSRPVQAYMVLDSDWRPKYDNVLNRGSRHKIVLNKPCTTDLPEGFKIYKTLKSCTNDIVSIRNAIIVEVLAVGEIYDYENASYVHTVFPVRTISPFTALRSINRGIGNAGKNNEGDCNYGSNNIGNYNAGDGNIGNNNNGSNNRGNNNNGQTNIGNNNNGWNNIGDSNNGTCNESYNNVGNYNKGNCNVGRYNKGNFNCGHYNHTNRSNGAFNTEEPKIYLFNKLSDWTLSDFERSAAFEALQSLEIYCYTGQKYAASVFVGQMTDEDKQAYPEYLTTNFCVKAKTHESHYDTPQKAWNSLKDDARKAILSLPNFDAKIFLEITGIDVNKRRSSAKKPASKKSATRKKPTSGKPAEKKSTTDKT